MWGDISKLRTGNRTVKRVSGPGNIGDMYLLHIKKVGGQAASNWMVGAYEEQTKLTKNLRNSLKKQTFISGHDVRFGMRKTDHPPKTKFKKYQKGYGKAQVGKHVHTNFKHKRKTSLSAPTCGGPAPENRRSDREQNFNSYWLRMVPQSHHIVEYNHLEKLVPDEIGVGPMDHAQLPCVLLAAELHQLYVGKVLDPTRDWDQKKLKKDIGEVYRSLYSGPVLDPLWTVAKIILQAAGAKTPV